MATFAEIDENNIVVNILKVPDSQEHRGQEYLAEDLNLGGIWKQTSFNTRAGIHYNENGEPDNGIAIRMNHAMIGGHYDPEGDAFYPPQPVGHPSFVLNKENYTWGPPISYPDLPEGYTHEIHAYIWNEEQVSWEFIEIPSDINDAPFDPRMVI